MTFLTTSYRKLSLFPTTLHLALPASANSGLRHNPFWKTTGCNLKVLEPANNANLHLVS